MFKNLAVMLILNFWTVDASAWTYEEFKSGMTEAELTGALQKRGLSDLVKRPIKGRPGAFVIQDRSKKNVLHFDLCNERVSLISIDIAGNVRTFVQLFQVEETLRGEPTARVYEFSLDSGIVATWEDKEGTFELFLASDEIERGLSVAKSYEDKVLSTPCKK